MEELCQNCQDILKYNGWEIAGVLASFLVAFVAIVAGFRDEIKKWFIKPNVWFYDKQYNFNQKGVLVTRLKLSNDGRDVARNVIFVAEELFYFKEGKEELAKNFCPYSLKWTHQDKVDVKDVFVKRPYYLDLCEVVINERRVRICSPNGDPFKSGLNDIKEGDNKLKVVMYCDNQKRKAYSVKIYWSGNNEDFILIKSIFKIK